jgi:hypothetical protein
VGIGIIYWHFLGAGAQIQNLKNPAGAKNKTITTANYLSPNKHYKSTTV